MSDRIKLRDNIYKELCGERLAIIVLAIALGRSAVEIYLVVIEHPDLFGIDRMGADDASNYEIWDRAAVTHVVDDNGVDMALPKFCECGGRMRYDCDFRQVFSYCESCTPEDHIPAIK